MCDCSEFTPAFFDEASKAWTSNKIRCHEGTYRYKKNAFPVSVEEPSIPNVTKSQKRKLLLELKKRESIDEYAPPRVRRSRRLMEKSYTT